MQVNGQRCSEERGLEAMCAHCTSRTHVGNERGHLTSPERTTEYDSARYSAITSIMSRTGPTSSSRALEAILPLISAGQPYEAHQKARTFATRYTKSGAHAFAIDVLFQSARELIKAGHAGSGTDLAILLLDSYDRASEPVNDVSRGMSTHLTHKAVHRLTLDQVG